MNFLHKGIDCHFVFGKIHALRLTGFFFKAPFALKARFMTLLLSA